MDKTMIKKFQRVSPAKEGGAHGGLNGEWSHMMAYEMAYEIQTCLTTPQKRKVVLTGLAPRSAVQQVPGGSQQL
jgi:hypothetical protein